MLRSTLKISTALFLIATGFAAPGFAQEAENTTESATENGAEPEAVAQIENVTRDTVVATVNGTEITMGQLIVSYTELPPQYQQLPADFLFEALLEQVIQQELLSGDLAEEPARVQITLDTQHRSLRAGERVQEITAETVNEDAVREAYETQYVNIEPQQEFNASHILVETQPEAYEVLERIQGGEEFADVAKEVSTDPGSGAQGGGLGWFAEGQMVPEFEEGVKGLEVGQISQPIESQFGFHIIRLDDVRDRPVPAFEEVQADLEAQLQEQAIADALEKLEAEAEIEKVPAGAIAPDTLTNLDLLNGDAE